MKFLLLSLPLSVLLVSCYPLTYTPYGTYNPYQRPAAPNPSQGHTAPSITTKPPTPSVNPPKQTEHLPTTPSRPTVKTPVTLPVQTPTYPYAQAVPGQKGFVLNPYTGNKVDVNGLSRGTLVRDPHDTNADHKFRVP